jgi:hypothetical protein
MAQPRRPTDPTGCAIHPSGGRSNAFDSFGPPLGCWLLGLQGETFDVTVSKDDVALSKGSYAFAALRASRWRGLGACRVLCVFVRLCGGDAAHGADRSG